jgi:hypothetical protein
VLGYVQKAVACAFHIGQAKDLRSRHHGSWFALRNMLSSALVMLAVIKSGDMVDYLADWPDVVENVIGNLRYWKAELPDLALGIEILQKTRHQVCVE